MTDASPRPWRVTVRPGVSDEIFVNIVDVNDELIAVWARTQEAESRAALIVGAVNAWDEEQRTMMDDWRARRKREQAVIDAALRRHRPHFDREHPNYDCDDVCRAARALDGKGE